MYGSEKEREMLFLIITLSVDSDLLAVRAWLLFLSYEQVLYVLFMNTHFFYRLLLCLLYLAVEIPR
jgi:hypothetical protein